MKNPATPLLAGLAGLGLLLAGCSTISSRQSAALEAAADRYAQAALEMTRGELVHAFGTPQKVGSHLLVWEVRYGQLNFERLAVELDSADRAAAIARTHSRFVWGPFPGGTTGAFDPRQSTGEGQPVGYPHQHTDRAVRRGYLPKEIQGVPGGPDLEVKSVVAGQKYIHVSFHDQWVAFRAACLNGNIEKVEQMCDRRILGQASTPSLQDLLGGTWKADRMLLLSTTIFSPYRSYPAAAKAQVEITENGLKHTETMWWLHGPDGWKCQNLPFAEGRIPAGISAAPAFLE